jgi:hypothetical protein
MRARAASTMALYAAINSNPITSDLLPTKEHPMIPKLQPCLWFDGNAEDAAKFYASTFPTAASAR